MTDELDKLRELPPIDVDRESADRIAARARDQIGRGESPLRFVEPIVVAVVSSSFLVWGLLKIMEVFR